MPTKIQNALISVYDKSDLEPLARSLFAKNVHIYSTGGTYEFLKKMGPVTKVEELTQFPEMMDGRVKTLHPKIFGGILARRDKDTAVASEHGIPLIDLVVVNLYPFSEHLEQPQDEQRNWIDIGGPAMLRAAAKNSGWVSVLSSPSDYPEFLKEYDATGCVSDSLRKQLAVRTFERTASYDTMVANSWGVKDLPSFGQSRTPLRYGENPHQTAFWVGNWNQKWRILQGKELSYNNLLDADAAFRLALDFKSTAVAIIKHNSPCAVAAGSTSVAELFSKAFEADSKSAFGGIVAVNTTVDAKAATQMQPIFLEVVIARGFSEEAKQILSLKKNLRLIEWANPVLGDHEVRHALGGWLVQCSDTVTLENLQVVTQKSPQNWEDLKFAWTVVKHARSNAIVLAKDGTTVSIGAGQVSRVDAVEIALRKGVGKLEGSVLASDAFFPFRDNIDLLKHSGITSIIQPGGSQRDQEVIDACNEHGISMAFTGIRHFRH